MKTAHTDWLIPTLNYMYFRINEGIKGFDDGDGSELRLIGKEYMADNLKPLKSQRYSLPLFYSSKIIQLNVPLN